jgi:hypothetical protein
LRFAIRRMQDVDVGRMITFVLLAVAVIAGIYAWQHRPSLDNPQLPAPGVNVVTIDPLP